MRKENYILVCIVILQTIIAHVVEDGFKRLTQHEALLQNIAQTFSMKELFKKKSKIIVNLPHQMPKTRRYNTFLWWFRRK